VDIVYLGYFAIKMRFLFSLAMAPIKIRTNRICFTLNNYSEEECLSLTTLLNSVLPNLSYGIIGKEVGQSGTPHLQGYIRLKPSYLLATGGTISKWKSLFPGLHRAHLEPAFGSDLDSEKYCSKDGNIIFQHGTPDKTKGSVWQAIFHCKTMDEIAEINPQFAVKNYFQAVAITRANSLGSTQPVPPKMLKPWQHLALTHMMNQPCSSLMSRGIRASLFLHNLSLDPFHQNQSFIVVEESRPTLFTLLQRSLQLANI